MGYHYKESGHGCWDILLTTKKGQEEGHLPKGVVILTGFQYADPDYRNWMKEIESSGRYHVSVAKHCDDEDELTHLSKNGYVNRFGFFLSETDPFEESVEDIEIEHGNWFQRKNVIDYKKFIDDYFDNHPVLYSEREKKLIEDIESAIAFYISSDEELEMDLIDGGWYPCCYKNGQSNVLTAYKNDPLITEDEAEEQNVDLEKVFNHCNVYHCG